MKTKPEYSNLTHFTEATPAGSSTHYKASSDKFTDILQYPPGKQSKRKLAV